MEKENKLKKFRVGIPLVHKVFITVQAENRDIALEKAKVLAKDKSKVNTLGLKTEPSTYWDVEFIS